MRIRSSVLVATLLLGAAGPSWADTCFLAAKKMSEDAENIRLKALDMGWVVGKAVSFSAASVIGGKASLYPKDEVEVCLRVEGDKLQIKVRSKAKDAGQAEWHGLPGENKPVRP
jgi:hypothetical protein